MIRGEEFNSPMLLLAKKMALFRNQSVGIQNQRGDRSSKAPLNTLFFTQNQRMFVSLRSPTAMSKIRRGVEGRESDEFKRLLCRANEVGTAILLQLMRGRLLLNMLLLPRRGAGRKDHRDEHRDEDGNKDTLHVG
jgi:hypothetical protein